MIEALLKESTDKAIEEITMGLRQEWEAAAEARGRAAGIAEGKAEGKAEGELTGRARLLLKLLRLRFGEPSEALLRRVDAASVEDLERWAERILSASSVDEVWAEPEAT